MVIRTYYIRFKEPLTQTWVEGINKIVASNDAQAADIMDEWELYFSRLYGGKFELRFCDWGGEK